MVVASSTGGPPERPASGRRRRPAMTRRWIGLVLVGIGLLGAGTFSVWAREKDKQENEQEVSTDQLPLKAREALTKLAGEAKIIKFERERKHDVDTYEGEWKANGHEHGAVVTADGALLETEESVEAKDVPEAVQKAAAKALKGATKLSYEKHTVIFYEVETKVLGIEREVKVYPTGRLTKP
jgi:hypothetical protein